MEIIFGKNSWKKNFCLLKMLLFNNSSLATNKFRERTSEINNLVKFFSKLFHFRVNFCLIFLKISGIYIEMYRIINW